VLIFIFVAVATTVRSIAVSPAKLKGIENAIERHRNDIKQQKKDSKSDRSWKRIVDGDVIRSVKTKKDYKINNRNMRRKIVMETLTVTATATYCHDQYISQLKFVLV
jgi:hypothetical protein